MFQVISQCPHECECKDEPKQCPPGVSLVTDGCNCCKVCARQAGQECNDDDLVCDSHRGLFCDFSKGRSGDWGVCAGTDLIFLIDTTTFPFHRIFEYLLRFEAFKPFH